MKIILKFLKFISVPILVMTVVLVFFSAANGLNQDRAKQEKENLERSLNRAAVACFAIEGAYPPSIEYLTENYRVHFNTDKYVVKYELYASNLMPSITVLEISQE